MNIKKALLLTLVAGLIGSYFFFDGGRYLSLAYLQAQHASFIAHYQQAPTVVLGLFFVVYVLVTALSLPGAAILPLAAGALFGFWIALVLVSFASTLGATLAFLASRFFFRDAVTARFGDRLKGINRGIEKEGAFYLFTLRLVPAFPFFMINLLMGLTALRTRTFYWVSQVGMLAGTAVYVNAGTQLAQLDSLKGLLSPSLLGAFVLLGVFPWIAKFIIARAQQRKVYKKWKKPKQFDRNLIVIGAGAAGLVSAYIAATVKAKVTLIEKHKMGGDCLNTGCVPSKALIKSARVAFHDKQAEKFGFDRIQSQFRFSTLMQRVHDIIAKIEPHDSVARYSEMGVDCRQGEARLVSPWEVEITHEGNTERLSARSIIIASGAQPHIPDIPGIENVTTLTSESLWDIQEQPKRLLVLGSGPIGCELAQTFARLGSDVTMLVRRNRILPKEDEDAAHAAQVALEHSGITLLTEHTPERFSHDNGEQQLHATHKGTAVSLPFDAVLLATGRSANTSALGLNDIGIRTRTDGTVETNAYLQTAVPNIYACGDVAGPFQFTHTAAHQAWYACVNALFGFLKKFKTDYRVIPWCTFTDPEIARVGLNEHDANAQGIEYDVTRYGIDDLDRAIADSEAHGFVKVLTKKGSDHILGVTIVGQHAGELIAEFVLAMKHGLGLNKILGTIHIYPTMSEANKFAAGEWKKARKPEGLLRWVEKLHQWRR